MYIEDFERFLYLLDLSTDDISRMINLLHQLIELIDKTFQNYEFKLEHIHAYTDALRALQKVRDCNEELHTQIQEMIAAFSCCSSPSGGSFGHGGQGFHRPADEKVASKNVLADAAEAIFESGVKAGASAFEDAGRDHDFDGTAGSPEKPCEGVPSHCSVCGGPVYAGAKDCPHCGNAVSTEKPAVALQKVQFSAVAPKTLSRGEYSIINIIMYEESSRHIVDELVNAMDEPPQEIRSGVQKVSEGAAIKIILNSPDVAIEDNIETGVWQGDYLDFSFALQIPENYKKSQILLTAAVYINDVIATKLKFIVKCSSQSEQKITVSRSDILSAFISYASQDRKRVAAIIQGMKKARPDLDVFFDVDSLRSGEDWDLAIHDEIKRRDVLFLCWSHFARESKWVDAEWHYALEQKGADCIEPVPIESPDVCPPPAELKYKHFNDKLLYIINSAR